MKRIWLWYVRLFVLLGDEKTQDKVVNFIWLMLASMLLGLMIRMALGWPIYT